MNEASSIETAKADPDVLAARDEAEAAIHDVRERLEALQASGTRALSRVARSARPIAVGVLVGAALLSVVLVIRRSAAGPRRFRRSRSSGVVGAALRFIVLTAARAALRKVVVKAVNDVVDRADADERIVVVAAAPGGAPG